MKEYLSILTPADIMNRMSITCENNAKIILFLDTDNLDQFNQDKNEKNLGFLWNPKDNIEGQYSKTNHKNNNSNLQSQIDNVLKWKELQDHFYNMLEGVKKEQGEGESINDKNNKKKEAGENEAKKLKIFKFQWIYPKTNVLENTFQHQRMYPSAM